jgi:hypothetical protein
LDQTTCEECLQVLKSIHNVQTKVLQRRPPEWELEDLVEKYRRRAAGNLPLFV